MSKFVLIVNFEGGVVDTPMEEWKPEEVQTHLDYYRALNRELRASGELVETAVLAGPDLAKIVTSNGTGGPMVTDGPSRSSRSGRPATRSWTSSRRRAPSRSRAGSRRCPVRTASRWSNRSRCGS